MILLNNDISSIVVGIEMGRLVFDNLKKVILYLMPVSSELGQCSIRTDDITNTGRDVYRVHNSLCQRLSGYATRS